jgi:hypothetical protein
MLCKANNRLGLSKIDGCVHHPDIERKGGNEPRRGFGADMGCNSLFVFGRSTSSSPTLLDVGGLVAVLGVRFAAGFLLSRPLSMAVSRLKGLLISVILNLIIITFGPLFLLYPFLFTSLSIRWQGSPLLGMMLR